MSQQPPQDRRVQQRPYSELSPAERQAIIQMRNREITLQEKKYTSQIAKQKNRVTCLTIISLFAISIIGLLIVILAVPSLRERIIGEDEENNEAAAQTALLTEGTKQALNVTQLAIEQAATQNNLSAQGTLTAMNAAATEQAFSFSATQTAFANQPTPTPQVISVTSAPSIITATSAPVVVTATSAPMVAAPVQTTVPAPLVPGSPVIDDTFATGIDNSVWDFDPSRWGINGVTLTSLQSDAWLLTKRADFSNYVVELWYVPSNNGRIFGVALNIQDDKGTEVYLSNNSTGWYGGLLYANKSRLTYRFTHENSVASSYFQDIRIEDPTPEDGIYIRIEVRGNRIVVSIEGQEVMNIQPLDASTRGAVGLYASYGEMQFSHIRLTPLQ